MVSSGRILIAKSKSDGSLMPAIDGLALNDPLHNPLNRVAAERVYISPTETPPRIIEKHIFALQLLGTSLIEWKSDGRTKSHVYRPGDMGVFPINEYGATFASHGCHQLLLSIDDSAITELAEQLGLRNASIVETPQVEDEILARNMLQIDYEIRNGNMNGRLFSEEIVQELLTRVLTKPNCDHKRRSVEGLPLEALNRVVEYIHEYHSTDVSLADLAGLCFMSPYHFVRKFKQSTGTTPHQYLLTYRVKRAITLMAKNDLPLKQIARSVGFCDQSHLTRHFKRLVGKSPLSYSKTDIACDVALNP